MQISHRPPHVVAQAGPDLERIRFLTRNFRLLQGLRIKVPMGLLLMAAGTANFGAFPLYATFLIATFAIFRSAMAEAFYRRRFGEVERPDRRFVTVTRPWALIAAVVFLYGNVAWLIAAPHNARPVYVFCGVVLIWLWLETGRSRYLYYYPLLGSLILAAGAPNATFGYLFPAMATFRAASIFAGAVIVVVGLLDHRQLAVGMPRLPRAAEDHEAPVQILTPRF
jgi:hypothetical protein